MARQRDRQLTPGFQAVAHVLAALPALKRGFTAESCRPASARMMGTPARSRVWIWRETHQIVHVLDFLLEQCQRFAACGTCRRFSARAAAP
jgi:hypothetical protein